MMDDDGQEQWVVVWKFQKTIILYISTINLTSQIHSIIPRMSYPAPVCGASLFITTTRDEQPGKALHSKTDIKPDNP